MVNVRYIYIFQSMSGEKIGNTKGNQPKQFWQIYEEGDFVDAKDNQGDWRVGYIVQKNIHTKLFKVRFDGWSSKYDQDYKFTSAKLLDFRTFVIGYTGQKKNPGIRGDWKFTTQYHKQRTLALKDYTNNWSKKTAREINQQLRGHNYFYTDFLMTRTFDDEESIKRVMNYFCLNIQLTVDYLKNIDENFVQYYKGLEPGKDSFLVSPESAYYHSFYEVMDTMFIIAGGYSRLSTFFHDNAALLRKFLNVDIEKNVKRYYQLFVVEEFLRAGGFETFEELLKKKLKNTENIIPFLFLKSLAGLFMGVGSQLTKKEKEPWLQHFIEITNKNIKMLNDKNLKDLHKSHVTELLDTIHQLFQHTSKDKQIGKWALQTEVHLCERMILCPFFEKKLKGVIGLIDLCEKRKNQLDGESFVKELIKIRMFQSLFTVDNAEIIKKAVELCKILYLNELLPYPEIYKIWELRVGKHEAALQEVYSLISSLPSRTRDEKFSIDLYKQISKVPEEQWDEDYIKMIKDYTLSAIGWVNHGQQIQYDYGFPIIYQYALRKQNQFSFGALNQVMDRIQKTQYMANFVTQCFEKLSKNIGSYPHVIILFKIVQEQLHHFKDENFEISEIIINDILRNVKDLPEKVCQRLELLTELFKILGINLSFEQFIKLYNQFRSTGNYILFLNWIQKKKQGGKALINPRISSDIRKQIFETVWSNNADFSNLSVKETEIFVEFFKVINIFESKIKRVSNVLKIQTLKLNGLERIWLAFKQVNNQKIAEYIGELIVEIYMSPSKNQEENKQVWVSHLVEIVSKKMRQAYAEKNISRVERLLIIPKKIIERDEEIFPSRIPKITIMKEYTIINKATKQEKTIRFNLGGICYDFKKLVAERFKIPVKSCKLSCKGETINYENYFKSLAECSFHSSIFEVQQEEVQSVKDSLNAELQLFFQLLGDKRIEKKVWDILSRLPIAKQFVLRIEKSEKPWQEISNPSIYKELYMMRVMGFMEEKWWELFSKGNGLSVLASKFERVTVKTKTQREYLKVLCEAIDKCLVVSGKKIQVDAQELILSLFASLNSLMENLETDEELENRRNTVQTYITVTVFKIIEKISFKVNPLTILLKRFPEPEGLLRKGLITVKNQFLRKEFLLRLQAFNKILTQEDTQVYLQIFFKKLFQFAIQYDLPEYTRQYFLFSSILIGSCKHEAVEKYIHDQDPDILNKIQHLLISEKAEETVQTINYLMLGYLLLLKQLCKFSTSEWKKRIINFILYRCFFSLNEKQELKSKSKQTRAAAFDLFRSVLKEDQIIEQSLGFLSGIHKKARWRTRKLDDWTLTPGDKQKSASGYVGIKNLGCTCYMNSFFQQIYMIPDFRRAILESQDPIYSKEGEIENVLFQLKKMFFNLSFSEQKYYTPVDFCYAFKDYQGNPTKVNEQMDIDEFSGILFDRLENQMRGTAYNNVIKDFFGGVFSNEIICKGCPHFSETEQSFLSISLSVKNKKNIYQSFDTMIKGDTLDGDNAYFCERCNKKVSAVKRVCLKKLPDHLILTLKRFQFDYQTMNKIKVNDYCEFPIDLNIKQYSQQFLRKQENPDRFDEEQIFQDSYYEYVLKGVAIHLGYADSGHYYSYIKERKDNGRWFEFNDTIVRSFDIRRLGEEAFGGQVGTFEIKEKIKNAYMLIYERKAKIKDPLPKKETGWSLQSHPVYVQMMNQVVKMNMLQKIENILFSDQYGRFSMDLIREAPKSSHNSAITILKYIVTVYLTVTIREKEELIAFSFLKKLHPIILEYPEVCEWIIDIFSAQTSLTQFFKNNPARQVKKLLAFWIADISKVCPERNQQLIIDNILAYISKTTENPQQLCIILSQLLKLDHLKMYAMKKNVVGRLLENILRKQPGSFKDVSCLKQIPDAKQNIGEEIVIEKTPYQLNRRFKPPTENGYVWAIICLVLEKIQKDNLQYEECLTKEEIEYLLLPNVKVYKILQECKNKFQINKFCEFLCYSAKDNQKYSEQLTLLIYKGLKEFESKRYRQFFVLFKHLSQIKDRYTEQRLNRGFSRVVKALKDNQRYTFDSNIIQQWLAKILKKNPTLQRILIKDPEALNYLTQLSTKKIPTEDICRKNMVFQESSVNKYHGIQMMKSRKRYQDLASELQEFYLSLKEKNPIAVDQWDGDQDLTEYPVKPGDIIGYFDQKDKVDFIEAKVEEVFLNRLWITHDKATRAGIWKDEEKLTTSLYNFTEQEESDHPVYSQNTTEMDQDDDELLDV